MRLIDADRFLSDENVAYMNAQIKLAESNPDMTIDATRYINQLVHQKIRMLISDAPTIEAECKCGEWRDRCRENEDYECSECGAIIEPFEDWFPHGYLPNFCPNCGADMRGESDETD